MNRIISKSRAVARRASHAVPHSIPYAKNHRKQVPTNIEFQELRETFKTRPIVSTTMTVLMGAGVFMFGVLSYNMFKEIKHGRL